MDTGSKILPLAGLVGIAIMSASAVVPAFAGTVSDGIGSISHEAIRAELQSVPADVRQQMNRDQLARFISNVLVDNRLMHAAQREGISDLPMVREKIARAARDIVVRAYIDGQMAKIEETLPDLTELARERYMVDQKRFVIPAAIRVSHILFLVNEEVADKRDAVVKERATQALRQLRAGADFAKLAKEFSEDPGSNRTAGEIREWVEKGKFVPAFETVAYALKPGEISDLVRTRFGYHIIKLNEKREARQQSFDEVKGSIITTLRKEVLGQKREELLKPFQGREPIVLDDATFEALKKPR